MQQRITQGLPRHTEVNGVLRITLPAWVIPEQVIADGRRVGLASQQTIDILTHAWEVYCRLSPQTARDASPNTVHHDFLSRALPLLAAFRSEVGALAINHPRERIRSRIVQRMITIVWNGEHVRDEFARWCAIVLEGIAVGCTDAEMRNLRTLSREQAEGIIASHRSGALTTNAVRLIARRLPVFSSGTELTRDVVLFALVAALEEHLPNATPRRFARACALANALRHRGYTVAGATQTTLHLLSQYSASTLDRALRDAAYFQYHLLRDRGTSRAPHASTHPMRHRLYAVAPHMIRVPAPATSPTSLASSSPRGLREAHSDLQLHDLIPSGVDAQVVAALIVYGFADLGKGIVYTGSNPLPEYHALANTRRRFHDAREDALRAAWRWLTSIGIIERHSGEAHVLNLRSDHDDAIAQAVAQRSRALFHRYRVQR